MTGRVSKEWKAGLEYCIGEFYPTLAAPDLTEDWQPPRSALFDNKKGPAV
jgi:hypothetical protein